MNEEEIREDERSIVEEEIESWMLYLSPLGMVDVTDLARRIERGEHRISREHYPKE